MGGLRLCGAYLHQAKEILRLKNKTKQVFAFPKALF